MQKRDLNYLAGIFIIPIFLLMLITGLIQLRFELHRFIYHIYGAYLIIALAVAHVFTNWRKVLGFIKNKIRKSYEQRKPLSKIDTPIIISIALVFSTVFTLISGFLQVKLNLPKTEFVYHVYSAYITLILALTHFCLNLNKINAYLKGRAPSILLSNDKKSWSSSFIRLSGIGIGLLITAVIFLAVKGSLSKEQGEIKVILKEHGPTKFDVALKYHQETKHTYAELMSRTGRLDWSKQPSVFKEYPQADLIKLSTDFDFDSISVEEAIEKGPFAGSFSRGPITEKELSRLLYYTNGITDTLRYPGLTYYLRAAPSAGALYPTVIYLVVSNVEGLKKGIYHYSVKDHAIRLLKEGDFAERIASLSSNPLSVRKASAVFVMSTIFYRTKWKYRERGYRYVLLDTGHVGGNLALISSALGLGSYSIGTFVDDKINQILEIDGLKEAVIYINAVGRVASLKEKSDFKKAPLIEKETIKKLPKKAKISELLHESGKLNYLRETDGKTYETIGNYYKNYPEAKRFYLTKEFSKQGLSLDDAIRKRRSARDYSNKPISQLKLSRLLYYSYGYTNDDPSRRTTWSIEGLYPIEIYVVVNNVEGVARGIYHYNVLEHALELLKTGDYRFQIANACLGQKLVGNANIAIIKTALFDQVEQYGDRGYRYLHLDAGAIGENIYLEAASMGLGVCGIGAFFDDQINEMLGIDGVKETVIYVTSVGRVI